MFTNQFSVKHNLRKLFLQRYERYLPTAFDESLSILEKMNQLIKAYGKLVDVVNAHTEHTGETMERGFEIIDDKMEKELKEFHDELVEQKRLYEDIRDKIHSDLLPDSVKQKLEEWLLNGTIEDLINETIFGDIRERLEFVENIFFPPEDEITFYVPRDFEDLQSAIDFTRKIRNGVDTEIIMQSGFQPSSGINVINHDLGHIIIKSEDDVVTVSSSFSGHFLRGYNATLPRLSCLVDMDNKGSDGYRAEYSSKGVISPQCGVINAGDSGLYARTSVVTGAYANFSGANGRGLWATRSANVSLAQGDLSGCKGSVGAYVSRASNVDLSDADISNGNVSNYAVWVVRSRLNMLNADISNTNGSGLFVSSTSNVTASNCNMNNITGIGINCRFNSVIHIGGSTLSRCGGDGIRVDTGSTVTGGNVTLTRCEGVPLTVIEGSRAVLPRLAANTSTNGILISRSYANLNEMRISLVKGRAFNILQNSDVDLSDCLIQSIDGIGLYIDDMSRVNLKNGFIDFINSVDGDSLSGIGLRVSSGSTVNARLCRFRNNGRRPINCVYGSTVAAAGAHNDGEDLTLDDVNLSSFNQTSSAGVIYN